MQRITLGNMQNPIRGLLHGTAAVASVGGLIVLIISTLNDRPRMLSMIVFGVSLVALYTTSALYHSIPWGERWKARMQRIDHSMILLLVAGSFTPFASNLLEGGWRIATLAIVWSAFVAGTVERIVFHRARVWLPVALATTMGCFAVVPLPVMADRLAPVGIVLLLAGGVAYLIGMIAFATKRPRLFPRIFSYHEVFHVLVVAGSLFHFAVVLKY
ncbi:MAG: hemolysin III family protein, partial [Acidimicrobiia bacterium]|nr:hemolysin III family protein [Acidimicrobiia bacterium]